MFNFFFQNGKFISSDTSVFWNFIAIVLGALIGSFSSGLISIYIFKQGIRKEKEKENEKEQHRLRDIKSYFIYALSLLSDPLEKQANELAELSKLIKNPKDLDYNVKQYSSLSTQYLLSLNQVDLFKAMVIDFEKDQQEKSKNFQTIQNKIFYLSDFLEHLNKNFNSFMIDYDRYQDAWNKNISQISNLFDSMKTVAVNRRLKPNDDPFLGEFDEIFHKWSQIKNEEGQEIFREKHIAIKEFIEPLRNLCRKYPGDLRIPQLLYYIMECIYIYKDFQKKKIYNGDFFETLSKTLLNIKKEIEGSTDFFK